MFRTAFFNSILVVGVVLFAYCGSKAERLPYYNTPDFTPVFIESTQEVPERITHRIGSFSLQNERGETITEQNVDGKIHVANFIFTSCGSICPAMTKNMKKAGTYFAKDSNVVFLSFSVTPWIDSVAKLRAYKALQGIGNVNWHFLTGDKDQIYTLARRSYFAEEDLGFTKDSSQFLHTEHVLLVDATRRIRGIYNGTLQLDIEQLIKDIEVLRKERR